MNLTDTALWTRSFGEISRYWRNEYPPGNILIESAQYSVEPRPLNIFYSSQDIIKDQAEQKAMFSPLQ